MKFTFALFDMNGSGRVDPPEVFQLLRMTMGKCHSDNDLQAIVDGFLARFPNGMTYEVFVQMLHVTDLEKLTLSLLGKE